MKIKVLNKISALASVKENINHFLMFIRKRMDFQIATYYILKNIKNESTSAEFYQLNIICILYIHWQYGFSNEAIINEVKQILKDDYFKKTIIQYLSDLDVQYDELILEINYIINNKSTSLKKIQYESLSNNNWNVGDVYYIEVFENFIRKDSLYNGSYDESFYKNKIFYFLKVGDDKLPIMFFKIGDINNIPLNIEDFNNLEYIQIDSMLYELRVLPIDGQRDFREQLAEKLSKHYQTDEYGYLTEYRLRVSGKASLYSTKIKYLGNYKNAILPKNEYIHNNGLYMMFYEWKQIGKVLADKYYIHNKKNGNIYKSEYTPQLTLKKLIQAELLKEELIKGTK